MNLTPYKDGFIVNHPSGLVGRLTKLEFEWASKVPKYYVFLRSSRDSKLDLWMAPKTYKLEEATRRLEKALEKYGPKYASGERTCAMCGNWFPPERLAPKNWFATVNPQSVCDFCVNDDRHDSRRGKWVEFK